MTATFDSILDELRTWLSKNLQIPGDTVTSATELAALGLDSLDAVNLSLHIESTLGIEFDSQLLGELSTVADLLNDLSARLTP